MAKKLTKDLIEELESLPNSRRLTWIDRLSKESREQLEEIKRLHREEGKFQNVSMIALWKWARETFNCDCARQTFSEWWKDE